MTDELSKLFIILSILNWYTESPLKFHTSILILNKKITIASYGQTDRYRNYVAALLLIFFYLPCKERWKQGTENWKCEGQVIPCEMEPGHALKNSWQVGRQEEWDDRPGQVVRVGDGTGSTGHHWGQNCAQLSWRIKICIYNIYACNLVSL